MSFWNELKRRKVVRVAVVYAATAFAVLQAADIMLPQMGVPPWALSLVVALVVLGFPIALVLGWALEVTPDGIRRTEATPAAQVEEAATPALLGKRTLVVAGLLVVLGIGLSAGWLLKPGAPEPVELAAVTESAGPGTPIVSAAPDALIEPPAAAPARGVGVLPFANLSPDPDNAFFASGVHEEVLTRLSLIPELRVISRTSMEKIAGDGLEVSEIGRRLGVSHVLEGSVRRAGERVRVTVQLIEAATDQHIWAENFDRTLDDTFTIQSDIALAIAAQLEASLNPQLRASIEARPTDNAAAYDLYLRAREESRVWRGAEGFRSMIELLEPAVELDPDFLAAKALLSSAYGQLYLLDTGTGGYDRKARALVTELRQRWPDRAESRRALAQYHRRVERNFELALVEFQALLAEQPNDVENMVEVAITLKWLGRSEEFLEVARRVRALDPESSGSWSEMLVALRDNDLGEEYLALAEQAKARFPTNPMYPAALASGKLIFHGDREAVLAYGRTLTGDSGSEGWGLVGRVRFAEGDVDGALEANARQRAQASGLDVAMADATEAQYLRLAGRDAEAEAPARRAFEAMRDWIGNGRPMPGGNDPTWFANAARVAALAGEREAALAWQARALAVPANYLFEQGARDAALANAQRWLGDQDAAWALLEPYAGNTRFLSDGVLLGLQPYYDALYGEAAGYRAYMARLRAESGR
jgi:TolB-like protein